MRKIIYVDNFLTGHGHTPTTGATLVKLFREAGYTVIPTSSKQNKLVRFADMLSTIISNRRNSVVLIATYSTSAFYFAWACSIICHRFRVPYVPCLHGGNLPERIKRSPKLAAQVFAKSFMNIAVSPYLQQSLIDNGWKSLVIPNNIKLEAYPFKKRVECSPTLLWVRSFHAIYNPVLAIRILSSVLKKYPEAQLIMVGPDKDGSLEECKQLVTDLQLENHIIFKGLLLQEEWVRLAANCDIFINTTNFDNLPVSVVEAMALGMVIISSNVGGVPFLIEHEKSGLLVAAGDEKEFTGSIFRVIDNRELAETLSTAARAKAEEFDWEKLKPLWRNLFDSIS